MSIDMSQFHQVFFDETEEHLASMESLLLSMNVAQPEPEDLNAVFRAAHSIKGGAATFGFTDIADLTHVLENLLDQLRKGERALTTAMVDLFLQSKDVLQAMLSAHKGGAPARAEQIQHVASELERLAGQASAAQEAEPDAVVADALWTLYLELDVTPEVDMPALIKRLEQHGDISVVQHGDPESALPWVLIFTSPLDADEVAESLAFSLPPQQFRVTADQGVEEDDGFGLFMESDGAPTAVAEEAPAEIEGFGLFADEDPPAAPVTEEIEGFGLFEALPQPVTLAPAPQEDAPAAPAAMEPGGEAGRAGRQERGNVGDNSIRVNIEKVDLLLNLVGELVITQSMLMQYGSALDPVENERLLGGINALQRNSRELQEAVMSIRMTPIAFVFNRFPRVVRDLASRLGKQVELKTVGENTELDKGFIEKLSDPLTHLVRNSLDHGIESPEERIAKGKAPQGRLTLRAFHQGGSIVIEVNDDGAGLDRERILAKARDRGMIVHDSISDAEVWALIFEAGFSTASEVTDVSGRGVGMDVVRRNIQSMGGRIEIESMKDVGTTMSIRLPLTLAIMDGMSVRIGKEIYVLPLGFILESLQPGEREVKTVVGRGRVVNIRGEYLPIVALGRFFSIPEAKLTPSEGILVIVESSETRLALLVDDLIGQQQFVVKNLETNYRKVEGISGATIMGDGQVALILDISTIARHNQRAAQSAALQSILSGEKPVEA